MDRLIVLACLIGVGYCSICPNYIAQGSGSVGAAWTSTFQASAFNIAQEIVQIDEKIQKFCQYYSNYKMVQLYGAGFYQLSIVLPDFDEDTIEVKVMHRLLIVSAMNCGINYADVKLLPDVIDTRQGAWRYYEDELFIMFPYKKDPSQPIDKHCHWWIDPSKLTVKKMQVGGGGLCFGFCGSADGIIRDNVWHASGVSALPNRNSFLGIGHGANGYAGNGFGSSSGFGSSRGFGGRRNQGQLSGFGHGNIGNGVFGK